MAPKYLHRSISSSQKVQLHAIIDVIIVLLCKTVGTNPVWLYLDTSWHDNKPKRSYLLHITFAFWQLQVEACLHVVLQGQAKRAPHTP
jgi:hypothetical protein